MPEFSPSSVHGATLTFSNPKSVGFDFEAIFCMGEGWEEKASASFHLDAGQSKPAQFQVTMPEAEGTYPVYVKVNSGGVLVTTFVATEDIVIAPAVLETVILTPVGAGFQTQLTPIGDSPNWRCVDDVTPDDMATCVRSISGSFSSDKIGDLYTLSAFPELGPVIISWVQFWIRCHMTGGDYPGIQAALGGVILRTYNKNYYTTLWGEEVGWVSLPWQLPTNPYTELPWTVEELNNLQAGDYLWGHNVYRYCTQVKVEVGFTRL